MRGGADRDRDRIIVLLFVKLQSVGAYRRTALVAPILIAIPFAIAMAAGLDHSVSMMSGVALYGVAAVIVGYSYVGLVEIGAFIVRLLSRRMPGAEHPIAH